MIQKGLAALAALLLLAQSHPPALGQLSAATPAASHKSMLAASQPTPQPSGRPSPAQQTARPENPASAGADAAPAATPPTSAPTCVGADCDMQPAHISIATPAPAPAPWTWQQRVTWGAELVLVVLGYVAILMGLSLLRKIERQTRYSEAAAQAAQESAQAALAQTQALVRAERPWVLMSVLPSPTIENGFLVMASNRGRGPARILSLVHEIVVAPDESKLPPNPEFRNQPLKPAEPRILLPGETTEILSFSREDVRRLCRDDEQFARIERWEEKIYLYGRVVYRDLAAPDDAAQHESCWFCWYIHGRQKSGMITAGLPAYNRHC